MSIKSDTSVKLNFLYNRHVGLNVADFVDNKATKRYVRKCKDLLSKVNQS